MSCDQLSTTQLAPFPPCSIQTAILALLVCLVFLQLGKNSVEDGNTMVSVLFFSVVNL